MVGLTATNASTNIAGIWLTVRNSQQPFASHFRGKLFAAGFRIGVVMFRKIGQFFKRVWRKVKPELVRLARIALDSLTRAFVGRAVDAVFA